MRRPLFWYKLSMWLVSFVISAFLIQLGGLIMSDVPTAGKTISQSDFVDHEQMATVSAQIAQTETALRDNANAMEDAQFRLTSRSLDYQNQRATFDNWIKTRSATQSTDQNPEVVARVTAIEALKLEERKAEREIEALQQAAVAQNRILSDLQSQRRSITFAADGPYETARSMEVLKVFLLRLALTLPLLLISGWLVYKKRASTYWPVFRSFVIFALFAFFVELVPYLPSYGGYVRTIVGIIIALLAAHFAIKGMSRYMLKKQSEEAQPETEKRKQIDYEIAVKKITNCVCPSCDRPFGLPKTSKTALVESKVDFCVHCGFCLFDRCESCGERENSFYKFCGACGVPSSNKQS